MLSPIQQISFCGNRVFVKRDDLLPFSFGGNKARIAKEFFEDMKVQGKNCMIGYGNARSNLSRALANLCASESIECHLVSPADDNGIAVHTFNEKMCSMCGASFHYCQKDEVSATINSVIELCKKKGLRPYYINGNIYGKGNEQVPVRAYYKAYQEIREYEKENGFEFDYIFLPVGTGMTQAGLLCGIAENAAKTKVVGISIARETKKEIPVLRSYLDAFASNRRIDSANFPELVVDDSFLSGGYGRYDSNIQNVILDVFVRFGIPLDPNYSGKAFWGMNQYLSKQGILNKNILFMHTGGIPLFFDFLAKSKEPFEIERSRNKSELFEFVNSVDATLPVPLSERVDLGVFVDKVLANGVALVVKQNGFVKAASFFYCNDVNSKIGYITLIAIRPENKKQGYASALLNETESVCKNAGMNYMALNVNLENTKAIALYSKCGFRITSIENKVYMKKKI